MRILVVNAHGNSLESKKSFDNFLECVKEVLQNCVGILGVEDGCIVRSKDEIDEYLFGDQSSFYYTDSARRFDALDMVLISGDSTILPWSPSAQKIATLMKMCLRVKKYMLVTGSAMETLVYISASNLSNAIKVINGKGKGSKIGDIGKINIPIESIRTGLDCFLDAVTGDLYTFRHESTEWIPICNVGLHNVRLAQEYNTLGKYVIQAPVYRPKQIIQDRVQTHCFFENFEVLCYLKKAHSNHWLFVNCGLEFPVAHKSKWHVHGFKFPDPDKTYEVIAESDDGPFIIEFRNIIGIKFEISKKYPETRHIIHNFIGKCSKEILGLKKSGTTSILKEQSVDFGRAKRFIFKHNKDQDAEYNSGRSAIASGSIRSESIRLNRVYTSHGSNRNSIDRGHQGSPEPDERSKMSKFRIRRNTRVQQSSSNLPSLRADSESRGYGRSFSKPQSNVSSLLEMYNEPDAAVINNRDILTQNPESPGTKHTILRNANRSTPSPSPGLGKMTPSIKKLGAYNSTSDFNQREFPFSGKILNSHNLLTKESIRRYLYPDLDDFDNNFEKKNWVPGNMTNTKKNVQERKKVRIAGFPSEITEAKAKSPRTKTPRGSPELNHQTLRSSTPYKTYEEVLRDYEKKESQKIIGSKIFFTSAKKSPTNLQIPNYKVFTMNIEKVNPSGALTSRF